MSLFSRKPDFEKLVEKGKYDQIKTILNNRKADLKTRSKAAVALGKVACKTFPYHEGAEGATVEKSRNIWHTFR